MPTLKLGIRKLEEENKNLNKECRNFESQLKALNEKFNNINVEKGDLIVKYKNLKNQDENNLKEIKKLSMKINDLNNENKSLILQIEEIKKIDREKLDNIDNFYKNLNCNQWLFILVKEKEIKTLKENFNLLKKENEALIKENKEYALAIESIEKDLTNEENRQANEIKKSLDGYKERENNLIAELKTLKSLNEVIKKEVEINKKDLEIFKQKLESKILENTGLKDEIRGMKHLYKQSKKKFLESFFKLLSHLAFLYIVYCSIYYLTMSWNVNDSA